MATITIRNLTIQFDAPDDFVLANVVQTAKNGLELINLTLQREPYGMDAQIMNTHEVTQDVITVEPIDGE